MKASLRELIPDIKAAARIGHPQSLQAALDGLRAVPEVSGNSRMQPTFIESVIIPIGLALNSGSLRLELLDGILQDPLAGVRAAAAAALGARFAAGENVPGSILRKAGLDSRAEVRLALAHGLSRPSSNPELTVELLQIWLRDRSPRLQESVLLTIPGLQIDLANELLPDACALDPGANEEVDKALVSALVTLADRGAAQGVLECLRGWAKLDSPPLWVVTRSMMRSWVQSWEVEAVEILDLLQARLGPAKEIAACRDFVSRQTDEK